MLTCHTTTDVMLLCIFVHFDTSLQAHLPHALSTVRQLHTFQWQANQCLRWHSALQYNSRMHRHGRNLPKPMARQPRTGYMQCTMLLMSVCTILSQ